MTRASLLFGGLLVLAVIPLFVQDSYTRHLFILAFIYAVIASNWDLSLGYAGLFNFGHLVFFATGVYTVAIAAKTLGISPWLAIPMSGVTAAIAGLIVSAPVARLKGIYVVLVTFAFGQLVLQLILSQSHLTGGAEGMVRIPYLQIGDYKFISDFKLGYYYVALGLLIVSTLYLLWVTNSTFGKSLLAVRDNEDYARARGIWITRQRVLVLTLSAIFPGVAGGFFAAYLRVASPEVLSFGTLSLALSMVLIGGAGTIIGPIIAAFLLIFATEAMAGIRGMEDARFLIVAIGMILVLRFAPGGLAQLVRAPRKKP
ncbi:MAG: branched-chain amino acid ABC transporter permease [Rhodobacteraceae bacterium]|nr:branched-chain amino acid ABC transporter permease [Paracoccaceae bacterium]